MEITSANLDPELGCTAFTVERITYTLTRSGTASWTVTAQALNCNAYVARGYTHYLMENGTVSHGEGYDEILYVDQSDAGRAAHKAVPVQYALTLAGAVESSVITVNAQV